VKNFKMGLALLAATLMLAACGGGDDDEKPRSVTSVKVMGDSLADSGTFTGVPGFGRIFSVQGSANEPNVVWTERIAVAYGLSGLCNYYRSNGSSFSTNPTPGCSSYAIGGSRINNLADLGPLSPLSIPKQLQDAGAGGNYPATDLLLIDGGGNDAADLVTAYLRAAAGDTAIYPALLLTVLSGDVVSSTLAMPNGAAQAGNLYMNKLADRFYNAIQTHALDKGAKRVAILNVPAVTNTPRFQLVLDSIAQANGGGTAGATARAQAKALFDSWVVSFNTQLGVRASGNSAVAIVDFYAAFNDQLANPAKYGLANTTTPVCPATGAGSDGLPNYNFQTCTAALLSSAPLIPAGATANWWQTYLFSDGFHPTPFGHQLLADAVATRLRQAGWL